MHRFAGSLIICAAALFGMASPGWAQDDTGTEEASSVAESEVSESGTDSVASVDEESSASSGDEESSASSGDEESSASSGDEESSASVDAVAESGKSVPVEGEPEFMTEALLDKQLREVSTSVDTLKEDTFTTKSRLLLLREEVLQRSVGGSRLQVRHKFDMGGQYEMVQVIYILDQEPILSKQDPNGGLNEFDDEVIFDKLVAPGPHQMSVLYVYKGRPWGVYRYMTGYTFRVESGYDFNVDEGKAAELIITAGEDGNFFTSYENRPGVKYNFQQYDLTPQTAKGAEGKSADAKKSSE